MTVSLDIIQLAADALNQTTVAGKKRKGSLIPEIFSIDSVDPKNIKNYYLQLSPSASLG
jgi:hypothetical protein